MAQIGVKLAIDPEVVQRLRAEAGGLWRAAHGDGSDNRINVDAVIDAAVLDTSLGILTAAFQGLRKAFRNRGKTREDLAAEKEAAQINLACEALTALLLDYLQGAQAGTADPETLDALIHALEEMEGYHRSGKLTLPGEGLLSEIDKSAAALTSAMTASSGAQSPEGDIFGRLRAQLVRQKQWIEERETV